MSTLRIEKTEGLGIEECRGYAVEEVQVFLSDGRNPRVLIWYFDQRDGFEAEVDYEIWNDTGTAIVQEARTIPGSGFDYDLVIEACSQPHVIEEGLVERAVSKDTGERLVYTAAEIDNYKDLPW